MTAISWQNLLTPLHDSTGSRVDIVRKSDHHSRALLARESCRLSAAARADRAAARLFVRAPLGVIRFDASGVDARGWRRSRHHRPVRAGRHALHVEIPLGAIDRRAASAVFHAEIRPPPRLAAVLATL